jgi:trigger factor
VACVPPNRDAPNRETPAALAPTNRPNLKTTVTELPDSRVRLQVQVPPDEIERRLERKARELGRQLKLPGFRRGKVPAPLVIRRIGREAVLEDAVRDTLSSWYADAVESAGLVPVGDPRVELGEMPAQGHALAFSVEIGVLPKAQLGEYKGLEVARREPQAGEEQIEQEIDAMRERLARLQTAERPADSGDYVVVDYRGALLADADAQGERAAEPFAGGEGRDQLVELGAGNLIPGFEEGLIGASAGETRTVPLRFPDDYGAEHLAGRDASFEIAVKEVKRKELPELDEDFAADAGFDDMHELREDIRRRLTELDEERIDAEFRQAALDAAVAASSVHVPDELAHRGLSREAYLRIAGRCEEEILADMQPEAEQALRREAVITAVVAAEGISPSDEALLDALAPTAEREDVQPHELYERLRAAGRLEEAREDLAAREAIDLIASTAKPIPLAQAHAREQLWTPEKAEREAAGGEAPAPARLWTPGAEQRSAG